MGLASSKDFDPDRDIGSLEGKVILVTGATNGLGKESVLRLAKHNPKNVFLCARTRSKGEAALRSIQEAVPDAAVTLLDLDLASFASIQAAAESFNQQSDRLDILINNAGVMMVPPTRTAEGYEVQWATNHLGHFLLAKLLLPTLLRTAADPGSDVRIVNLSSEGNNMAPAGGIQFSDPALPDARSWTRYGQSKLANILFTKQLAKMYPDITSVAVHPGAVVTGLADTALQGRPYLRWLLEMTGFLFLKTVEDGAKNQLWAATAPLTEIKSGSYYVPVGKERSGHKKYAGNEHLAEELWKYSDMEVIKHGF